jgi:hypothetical protein
MSTLRELVDRVDEERDRELALAHARIAELGRELHTALVRERQLRERVRELTTGVR